MYDQNFLRLKQLAELVKELGLDEVNWIVNGLWILSNSWNEELYQRMLSYCMHNNFQPLLDTTFQVPVRKDDLAAVDGIFKIATIADTGIEFGLHPLQLQMHGVIGGGSGYGKSTFIKILCQQIMSEGKTKIWLIDPKEGGDYRSLARQFQDLLILRPDVILCNPFNMIKNVPVKMLRESVSEITADSFGVYDASESVITEHVQRIFEEHEQPNIYDFISSVYSEKVRFGGRRPGYIDTIKSRLIKIDASLESIVNCKTDYSSKLYDRDVVFELGSLSGSAQRVLVPWIIMKLVLFKIMNPTRELSHILVFDEAQSQLWSRNLEMRGRQSSMATLATQSRAYGLGILVLAQNPATKLMTEIIANSCIKLCFHLGSGQEIHQMGQHMGLSFEQMDTLHHLKRGEAICRVGLGYTEPVHLEIYNFQDQPVSNDELSSMMKPAWDRLLDGIEPARLEPKPQEFIEAPKRIEQTGTRSETDVKVSQTSPDSESSADSVAGERLRTSPDSELTSDEQAYLRIVKSHPWRLISEGYALLNNEDVMGTERISQSRAVKTRKKLLNKRFLEVFTVLGTGKSGRSLCDIVAEKANMGKVPKPRGGLLHAWWSYRIGAWYKIKGAEVKIGDTLGGNECDVGLMLDGKSIGFEVVVSGLVVGNLEKHLSYYDEMIVGCIDSGKEKEMIKLIENLTDGVRKRVKVELLKKYFVSL